MNADRNRRNIRATKRETSSSRDSHGWSHYLLGPIRHIPYVLLISLITVAAFAGLAFAEPEAQTDSLGEARVANPTASSEDTTGTVAKSNQEKDSAQKSTKESSDSRLKAESSIQPKSEPNGKYYIGDYDDPGKPKEKQNFFVGFLYTVFGVIKYVLSFALVIGIGILTIYGVKIFTTKYNAMAGGGYDLINVLETRYIAPGKSVCLVEVAGKVLVLGVTGNNINPLSELTDIEQVDALKQMAARKPEPLQPFQAYLEKFSNRFSGTQEKRSKRPVKRKRDITVEDESTHWRDDLKSTGENISKILEEIKKQDKTRPRDSGSATKRGRGEKGK